MRPHACAALAWILVAAMAGGCGREARPTADAAPAGARQVRPDPTLPLVVFLGDSLTAGYGLPGAAAFPERVQELLARRGIRFRLVNAGVSGDTTAGGLARLPWLLRQQPRVVVVGLGGNDGLRGLSLEVTEENLRQILLGVQEAGSRALLLGMRMPPNYGPGYTAGFEAIYRRLAAELEVPLVPFLLAGVGGRPELNLADGIHPNAEGHRLVARTVAPYLEALLSE